MDALLLLLVYCGLIAAVSLAGGRLSSLLRMTHLRTQLLMSGVGGLMLGIAMLHLLPHATETLASPSRAGVGALAGLVVMFLLVRLFHTHDHNVPALETALENGAVETPEDSSPSAGEVEGHVSERGHEHGSCSHDHHHDHSGPVKGISWFGLFFGLLLHTLVDGIALSASVIAESEHQTWLGLAGVGTFLAVALHKPLDAFAITSVMNRQHWSTRAQWAANIAFSLACPIGALAFYFGVIGLVDSAAVLGWGLAVSAGFFIGIALADLLPEVAFHHHDRGKLTATFLLGVGIAVGVENLPGHSHQHGPLHENHDHHGQVDGHDGHDHGHGDHGPEDHDQEGHGHEGHDHNESDQPESFGEAVEQIEEMGGKITAALANGNPEDTHDQLHEIGHVIECLPELATRAGLTDQQQSALRESAGALMDAFGELDGTLHGGESIDEKQISEAISTEIEKLQGMR